MTNAQYRKMVEQSAAALKDAQELHASNLKMWAEENGPFQIGKKIDAPFELKVNHPEQYNAQVTVIMQKPVNFKNLDWWLWEVTASEGNNVYTFYKEINLDEHS